VHAADREDVTVVIDLGDRKKVVRHGYRPVYARWGVASAWLIETGRIVVGWDPSRQGYRRVEDRRPGQYVTLPAAPALSRIAVDEICGFVTANPSHCPPRA
jgi:hypothetical protein